MKAEEKEVKINKTGSVKRNALMNAILTMSSFIYPIVAFPYVSRVLMPEGIGKVNFATSFVAYFSMLAQMGIPVHGVRACARVRDDRMKLSRTVQELILLNLTICIPVYIVFGFMLVTVPKLREDWILYAVMGITIGLNAIGVEWLYKALEKYTYIALRSVVFKILAVVFMLMLVKKPEDVVIYGGLTVFAASAGNILNFWNLRNLIDWKPVGGYQWKSHIRPILTFFSMSVATTIYTNMDNVMLGFMKGDLDTGYYGAAVKVKQLLVSVVTSASAVLLPRASFYIDKGRYEEFYSIIKRMMHFIILVSVPMTVYFILYAREGIYLLSGSAYEGAVIPMQIIMPTLLLIGMTDVIGIQMLVPLGKEKLVLSSEIAGAVTDFLLNLLLIPRYGAAGAAAGTLAAEFVVWLCQMKLQKEACSGSGLYETIEWRKLIGGLIGAIFSVMVVNFVWRRVPSESLMAGFIKLVVSSIVFFGVYFGILLGAGESFVIEIKEELVTRYLRFRKKKEGN